MNAPARSSAALLRMAGRIARFGGWTIDLPSRRVSWSDELYEMLGYPIGSTPPTLEARLALYESDDRAAVVAALEGCIANGTPFDVHGMVLDARGRQLRMRTIGEALWDSGRIVAVQGALLDETEGFNQLTERQRLEGRLAATLEQMNEGILVLDPHGRIVFVNAVAEAALGRDAAGMIGMTGWEIVEEDSALGRTLRMAADTRQTSITRALIPSRDRWFEVRAYPVDEGLAIYFRDVHDEETARHAWRDAERREREQAALLDVARDAIVVRGLDHVIQYWNRAAARMWGWSPDEAIGRSIRELIYTDPEAFDLATASTMRAGEWAGELQQRTRDGRSIIASCRWTLVHDDEGRPSAIFSVNADVTDERRREAEQHRDERLESLGSLAGAIAHDLNNVLTPIVMAAELVRRPGVDESRRAQLLESIAASARRGADMTAQVLAFARGATSVHEVVSADDILAEAADFARDALGAGVRFTTDIASGLGFVVGDGTQLLQVVQNLLANARDAVAPAGDVELAARIVGYENAEPRLEITVRDTGVGIADDDLERIFEPFVTTKAPGKGTGLGLSTSRAVIDAHGGALSVRSVVGEGAVFTVALPWLGARPRPTHAAPAEAPALEGRGELVMIVDDEAAVRELARHALESYGYATVLAESGEQALTLLEALGPSVDLVLTDLRMPDMDGQRVQSRLAMRRPGLPVVTMSGSADDGDDALRVVLRKPFTAERLLGVVRAHLDEARAVT